MSETTNKGKDNLDQYPLLKKLLETRDNLIPDDDHLFRKPLFTEEEQEQLSTEAIEYFKKKYGEKKPEENEE